MVSFTTQHSFFTLGMCRELSNLTREKLSRQEIVVHEGDQKLSPLVFCKTLF